MATAPLKSQPLHNFPLASLKWGNKTHTNSAHRFRRSSDSVVRNSPPRAVPPSTADNHGSPNPESCCEPDLDPEYSNVASFGCRTGLNRFSLSPCSLQKHRTAVVGREGDDVVVEKKTSEKTCDENGGEELAAKPWNLRPRKVVSKDSVEIGTVSKNGPGEDLQETSPATPAILATENLPKSMRLRGFAEGHGLQRKEKRRFWISLSREEIDEDVYALTGSRPSRKPKKRSKAVQKLVDNVFPGLFLVGASADSFRVPDVQEKK